MSDRAKRRELQKSISAARVEFGKTPIVFGEVQEHTRP